MCPNQTVEIINALIPLITAILAAIPSYLVGARKPRPEEKALEARVRELQG